MKTDDLVALLVADLPGAGEAAARQRRIARLALVLAILVTAGAFLAGIGARAGLTGPEVLGAVLRKEALAICAATMGLWLAWRQMRPEAPGTWLWLVPVGLCAGLVLWEMAAIGTARWSDRMIGRNGFYCLLMIPLLSLLPLAAILANLKLGATTHPSASGALAGVGAAGIGAAIYALHCTDDSMLFVAFWYVPAALLLAIVGALAGRSYLRW